MTSQELSQAHFFSLVVSPFKFLDFAFGLHALQVVNNCEAKKTTQEHFFEDKCIFTHHVDMLVLDLIVVPTGEA